VTNSGHAATLRAASVAASRMYSERVTPRFSAAVRSVCFSSGETLTLMSSIIAVARRVGIDLPISIVRIYQPSRLLTFRIFGKVPHYPHPRCEGGGWR
jgi:hypothetical protein